MLSVVIDGSNRKLYPELEGIDYEIVESITETKGQYVTLVEKDADFSPGFFFRNLYIFLSNPRFKKLAMVAPSLSYGEDTIYGYKHQDQDITPVKKAISKNPYLIQTVPIQGAIFRRSALNGHETLSEEMSQGICLSIWENGSRIILNPATVYKAPYFAHPELLSKPSTNTLMEWRREAV